MQAASTPPTEAAHLRVVRSAGAYALLRALRVLLDGSEIGRVNRGAAQTFEIQPGRHVITVKMDWVESDPLVFECEPGARLEVRCFPPTFSWRERLLTPVKQLSKPFRVEVSTQGDG